MSIQYSLKQQFGGSVPPLPPQGPVRGYFGPRNPPRVPSPYPLIRSASDAPRSRSSSAAHADSAQRASRSASTQGPGGMRKATRQIRRMGPGPPRARLLDPQTRQRKNTTKAALTMAAEIVVSSTSKPGPPWRRGIGRISVLQGPVRRGSDSNRSRHVQRPTIL